MSESPQPKTYLFRSCRNIPLEDNCIGYGWDDINFSSLTDAEAVIHYIVHKKGWNIGRKSNQIRRFKAISKGDTIIVPWWGSIAIAKANGTEQYDKQYYGKNGCNQQQVAFYHNNNGEAALIPRSNLSEAFQKRLKIRTTIADFSDFQEEVDMIVSQLSQGNNYSWSAAKSAQLGELENQQKLKLLENIQRGVTNLKSGGLGFENLIKELLEIDGYTAIIQSKSALPSGIDADIVAEKNGLLGNNETGYVIQVKHHEGHTGQWGLEQLTKITAELMPEQKDYTRALITSASALTQDAEEYARVNGIECFTGPDVIDWIFKSFDQLDPKTQTALGMTLSPRII